MPLEQNKPSEITLVPLTWRQRGRLLLECAPLVFFVLAAIAYTTVLSDVVGPPNLLYYALTALIIILIGQQALNRVRDLIAGHACRQLDHLRRAYRARGRGRVFFGEFTQLGKLRLTTDAYRQAEPREQYQVLYSPASGLVWQLERSPAASDQPHISATDTLNDPVEPS